MNWRTLRNRFYDLLFPPRCLGCRQVGEWLCADCLSRIPRVAPPFCVLCGEAVRPGTGPLCPRCRRIPLRLDSIRSAVYFEGTVRVAVHHLKYRGRAELAAPLGRLLVEWWETNHPAVDIIVPVPLHTSRLRERGYNQAALLAHEMGRRIGLPVDETLLIRRRATVSQVRLNAQQRRENVRDAFLCPADVSGRRVLLLDDVATTGATLEACAVALRDKGAIVVHALTLARARYGRDGRPSDARR